MTLPFDAAADRYLLLFPSLQHQNLSLSDFPTHDMSADFVLLAEQRQAERELKEAYEVSGWLTDTAEGGRS